MYPNYPLPGDPILTLPLTTVVQFRNGNIGWVVNNGSNGMTSIDSSYMEKGGRINRYRVSELLWWNSRGEYTFGSAYDIIAVFKPKK